MATVGLSSDTTIEAKAPEEAKVMAMMTAVWSVGSVLISDVNFMPQNSGIGGECVKNCKECAGKVHSGKRKEPGTMQMTKLWQRHLHGL